MSESVGTEAWRPVMAALANPEMRRVVGLLMAGQDPAEPLAALAPSRRQRVVDGLRRAGLVAVRDDGALELRDGVFAEILGSAPVRCATGVDRFLRDGRIVQYPAQAGERALLLRWVAERALRPGEVVDESGMNDRLRPFDEDTAVLRRYLVDSGLVERREDGSGYALAARLLGEPGDPVGE